MAVRRLGGPAGRGAGPARRPDRLGGPNDSAARSDSAARTVAGSPLEGGPTSARAGHRWGVEEVGVRAAWVGDRRPRRGRPNRRDMRRRQNVNKGARGPPRWEKSGGVLLSQGLSSQVPSALEGLTSVFGMGTGVTPPLWPPKSVVNYEQTPRWRGLSRTS